MTRWHSPCPPEMSSVPVISSFQSGLLMTWSGNARPRSSRQLTGPKAFLHSLHLWYEYKNVLSPSRHFILLHYPSTLFPKTTVSFLLFNQLSHNRTKAIPYTILRLHLISALSASWSSLPLSTPVLWRLWPSRRLHLPRRPTSTSYPLTRSATFPVTHATKWSVLPWRSLKPWQNPKQSRVETSLNDLLKPVTLILSASDPKRKYRFHFCYRRGEACAKAKRDALALAEAVAEAHASANPEPEPEAEAGKHCL